MSELLETSPLGAILNSCVPNDDKEVHKKLCCFYLNDYILSTYKPSMIDEQEVILFCYNICIYILYICMYVLCVHYAKSVRYTYNNLGHFSLQHLITFPIN